MQSMRYPANFSQRVDLSRVNESYVRSWIMNEITRIQGQEDDILAGYVAELLYAGPEKDGEVKSPVDPRRLQLGVMAFLYDDAAQFVAALWTMLLAAQESPTGIPAEVKVEAASAPVAPPKPSDSEVKGGQEQTLDVNREAVDAHARGRERLHARKRTSSRSWSRSWSRSCSESRSRSPSGTRSPSAAETVAEENSKHGHHHERHHERHRERHHSRRSKSSSRSGSGSRRSRENSDDSSSDHHHRHHHHRHHHH